MLKKLNKKLNFFFNEKWENLIKYWFYSYENLLTWDKYWWEKRNRKIRGIEEKLNFFLNENKNRFKIDICVVQLKINEANKR